MRLPIGDPDKLRTVMQKARDRIPGGLADKKKPSDFDPKALKAGIEVEMEHTNDRTIATEIAMDHLTEDSRYYVKLRKVEKSLIKGSGGWSPIPGGKKGGRRRRKGKGWEYDYGYQKPKQTSIAQRLDAYKKKKREAASQRDKEAATKRLDEHLRNYESPLKGMEEQLDFGRTAERAAGMSKVQLNGAVKQLLDVLPSADAMDREQGTTRGGRYRDEISVYRQELAQRKDDPKRGVKAKLKVAGMDVQAKKLADKGDAEGLKSMFEKVQRARWDDPDNVDYDRRMLSQVGPEAEKHKKTYDYGKKLERLANDLREHVRVIEQQAAAGSIAVGTAWESHEGKRQITFVTQDGKVGITTEGLFGTMLVPVDQLDKERDFDARALASKQRMQAKSEVIRAAEAAEQAKLEDTKGFTDDMPAHRKAKVLAALNKTRSFNGQFMSAKQYVEQAVAEGARVVGDAEGNRLEFGDGRYMLQKDITKTAMEYARHLTWKRRDEGVVGGITMKSALYTVPRKRFTVPKAGSSLAKAGGWQPIPGGKKGGERRWRNGGYEHRYPDKGKPGKHKRGGADAEAVLDHLRSGSINFEFMVEQLTGSKSDKAQAAVKKVVEQLVQSGKAVTFTTRWGERWVDRAKGYGVPPKQPDTAWVSSGSSGERSTVRIPPSEQTNIRPNLADMAKVELDAMRKERDSLKELLAQVTQKSEHNPLRDYLGQLEAEIEAFEKAGGWGPIPSGKKGGQRKRVGMRWVYRYPDGRGGWMSGSAKKKVDAKRAEGQATLDFGGGAGEDSKNPPGTPRGDAEATTQEMIEEGAFVNDRKSSVEQRGEDVIASARHRALEWKGLRASLDGENAKRIFTRAFLSREKPIDFVGRTQAHADQAASQLLTHLCAKKIPTKPPEQLNAAKHWYTSGSGQVSQEAYNTRTSSMDYKRRLDEWLDMSEDEQRVVEARYESSAREQYYNAFTTLNDIFEKHSANPSLDPEDQYRNLYEDIRTALYKVDRNKNRVEASTIHKTYNAVVARGASSPRRQANALAKAAMQAHPEDATARSRAFTEAALKVMEGNSTDKVLGKDRAARRKFDISKFYDTNVMRRVGPPSRYESINQGLDLLDKSSGKSIFDLRGVQWGKSVTDDERKHHLKSLVDSWDDLSFVTGLPPEMAGYNGKLAIAVGARGKAGALAHYEPSLNVINLTRNGGAGALAHEWGHFFDFEVSKAEKRDGQSETDSPLTERGEWSTAGYRYQGPQGPTATAVRALRDSPAWQAFSKRLPKALRLNGIVTSKKMTYWRSNTEMFARCFERHVQTKLRAAGRANTYLSGLSNGNSGEDNLWPNDAESEALVPYFDEIFAKFKESGLMEKMLRWWADENRLEKARFTVRRKRFVVGAA